MTAPRPPGRASRGQYVGEASPGALLLSFGREIPLGLALLEAGAEGLDLVVSYRDGLERYRGTDESVASTARCEVAVEISKVLWQAGQPLILVGGTSLGTYSPDLAAIASYPAPDEEPLRGLTMLPKGGFLTVSDDESVRYWTVDEAGVPAPKSTWAVPCMPLFARPKGKSVICLENGRLGERDAHTGTLLKSWPAGGEATIVTAFSDPEGHSMVAIDEEGRAHLWDLHSRELLFTFDTPLRLHNGSFRPDGSGGVLLSQEGDLLTFRMASGPDLKPLPPLLCPAADAVCASAGRIVALDENGGIWTVGESPRQIGGSWAGWATSGLALADGRTLVGTASGELLLYPLEGGTPTQMPAHQDAVLALYEIGETVLSVCANGQVASVKLNDFGSGPPRQVASYAGEAVVGCHLETDGPRLWLALEEGRVVWLDPRGRGTSEGEFQFPEHRIEEIRPGGKPGEVLVLTDRGSLKRLSAE